MNAGSPVNKPRVFSNAYQMRGVPLFEGERAIVVRGEPVQKLSVKVKP